VPGGARGLVDGSAGERGRARDLTADLADRGAQLLG
jgi:hypothetical protein